MAQFLNDMILSILIKYKKFIATIIATTRNTEPNFPWQQLFTKILFGPRAKSNLQSIKKEK